MTTDTMPASDSDMMACKHCGHWHDSWKCPVTAKPRADIGADFMERMKRARVRRPVLFDQEEDGRVL